MRRFIPVVVAASLWSVCWLQPVVAQVTIDRPASILFFPKVIANGSRDTIIHIANDSGSTTFVRCVYLNAALTFPGLPPDPIQNPPLWTDIDFSLMLTGEQPSVWVASLGRAVTTDMPCNLSADPSCYGSGFDPGEIPALPGGFVGELMCVEADIAGSPVSGNHLLGTATVKDISSGDISRYRAIGSVGNENNDGDDTLCLGGVPTEECPNGPEYSGCPQSWLVDVRSEGAPVAGVAGSALGTQLTVSPCTRNLNTQTPETVTVQYIVTNEFEQTFSAASQTTCWSNETLTEINSSVFDFVVLGSPTARSAIRSTNSSAGVVLLAEEFVDVSSASIRAGAAVNAHADGERSVGDLITLAPVL